MPYLFAILGILIVANFYFLYKRSRKSRNVGKEATARREETVKRHDALIRRLDREQEEAARRVELRNKTLEMYDQVRKQAQADRHVGEDEQPLEQSDTNEQSD